MITVTSREFNQDPSKAKRAALNEAVLITDRGKPSHVLLSMEDYQKLTSDRSNIGDLLFMEGADDIDFAPAKLNDKAVAAEFS